MNKGVHAWPVEKGWWRRIPSEFGDQKDICQKCGMAVPMDRQFLRDHVEKFSPGLLNMFKERGLNRTGPEDVAVDDRKFTGEDIIAKMEKWMPAHYRGDMTPDELMGEDYLGLTKETQQKLIQLVRRQK